MKKSLKFVKYALLCVVSLGVMATGFTSCKDYDDDIDNLQKQIDANKTSIQGIMDQLNGFVKSVATNSDGNIVVTKGDGTTTTIIVNGGGGSPAGTWTVGTDGFWYNNGAKTDYQAVGGTPSVSEDGFWQFPTGQIVNGEVQYEKSEWPAAGAYIVDQGTYYELWIAAKGSTTLQKIILSKEGAGASSIMVLGWTDQDADAEPVTLLTDASDNNVLKIEAGILPPIKKGDQSFVWNGTTSYKDNQGIISLSESTKGAGEKVTGPLSLVIQLPAVADLDALSYVIQNSTGKAMPLEFGTPVKVKNPLTKASGDAGAYLLPIKNILSTTFANAEKAAAAFNDVLGDGNNLLFLADQNSGVLSNVLPINTAAAEELAPGAVASAVETVGGKTVANKQVGPVALNKDLDVTFAEENAPLDYYVEVSEATAAKYGITIDKAKGTFKITKAGEDAITPAPFTLTVFKLGYNGVVTTEEIAVTPERATIGDEVVYEQGNVLIKTPNGEDPKDPWEMPAINISLDKMFAALGTDGTNTWTGANGVATATFTLRRDDATTDRNAIVASLKPADAAGKNLTDEKNWKAAQSANIVLKYATDATTTTFKAEDLGKQFTLTINFMDGDAATSARLNTIKVTFTPVIPSITEALAKIDSYWIGNVMQAYYKNPITWVENDDAATEYDMTAAFENLKAIKGLALQFVIDPDQKIGNTKIDGNLATLNSNVAGDAGNAVIKLTQEGLGADNAYGQPVNIQIGTDTKYLGMYTYTKDQLKAGNFQVKVMSALYEGTIKAKTGSSIVLYAGATANQYLITGDHVVGETYTGSTYSLFKEDIGGGALGYAYTYIKKVEFVKTGIGYDLIDGENKEDVVEASDPVYEAGVLTTPSTVKIVPDNLASDLTTKITVRVTDRFHKVKEVELDLVIKPVPQPQP